MSPIRKDSRGDQMLSQKCATALSLDDDQIDAWSKLHSECDGELESHERFCECWCHEYDGHLA